MGDDSQRQQLPLLDDAGDEAAEGTTRSPPSWRCSATAIKWIALAVFFVGFTANCVTSKKLSIASAPYPYAQTQSTAFVGVLVYFPVVAVGLAAGSIRRHQLVITWWHPVFIGLMFSLHNVFSNVGNMGNTVRGCVRVRVRVRS